MIRFSEEKVLLLHQMIIGETGGSPELRDIGLLDSALEGCYQTFGGVELYPTKWGNLLCRSCRMDFL